MKYTQHSERNENAQIHLAQYICIAKMPAFVDPPFLSLSAWMLKI